MRLSEHFAPFTMADSEPVTIQLSERHSVRVTTLCIDLLVGLPNVFYHCLLVLLALCIFQPANMPWTSCGIGHVSA